MINWFGFYVFLVGFRNAFHGDPSFLLSFVLNCLFFYFVFSVFFIGVG